jgi:hypothetical protein
MDVEIEAILASSRKGEAVIQDVSNLFDTLFSRFLEENDTEEVDGHRTFSNMPQLLNITLALRNSCISVVNCEYTFNQTSIYNHIQKFFRIVGTTKHQIDINGKLVRFLMQLMANSTATGTSTLINAWFLEDKKYNLLRDMLAAASRASCRKTLGASIATVYNAIVNATDDHTLIILNTFTTCRPVWCQLLLALFYSWGKKKEESEEIEENDEAMEWMHMLIIWIMQRDFNFPNRIFRLVGKTYLDNVWTENNILTQTQVDDDEMWFITHEQVIILQLFCGAIEEPSHSWNELLCSKEFIEFVIEVSRKLCTLTIDRFEALTDEAEKLVWLAATTSTISFLGSSVSANVDASSILNVSSLLTKNTNIVRFCLHCLSDLPVTDCSPDTYLTDVLQMKSIFSSDFMLRNDKMGCLNSILGLIGNLLHRNTFAQDTFRDLHGFALVLPHCATNFDSPMTREWALLVIRHACEGNETSQSYVSELVPQGKMVLKDEDMVAAGITVEMDLATNKFTMKQAECEGSEEK